MRPLLNKDFRRLSWLLRQEPPQSVHGSSVQVSYGSLFDGLFPAQTT